MRELAPFATAGYTERSVVPACMEPRAPLQFEIRGPHGREIAPTLVGYRLRPGTVYHLHVRTQDPRDRAWKLHLTRPPQAVDWVGDDEPVKDGRTLAFRAMRYSQLDNWDQLRSHLGRLPVRLEFSDGREPYRFQIPILLLASRARLVYSVVFSAVVSLLPPFFSGGRPWIPTLYQLTIGAGVLVLTLAVFLGWDFRNRARAAHKLLEPQPPLPLPAPRAADE
jgi:hypothetical protein